MPEPEGQAGPPHPTSRQEIYSEDQDQPPPSWSDDSDLEDGDDQNRTLRRRTERRVSRRHRRSGNGDRTEPCDGDVPGEPRRDGRPSFKAPGEAVPYHLPNPFIPMHGASPYTHPPPFSGPLPPLGPHYRTHAHAYPPATYPPVAQPTALPQDQYCPPNHVNDNYRRPTYVLPNPYGSSYSPNNRPPPNANFQEPPYDHRPRLRPERPSKPLQKDSHDSVQRIKRELRSLQQKQREQEDAEKERKVEDKRRREREMRLEFKVQHLGDALRRERSKPTNWHTEPRRELLPESSMTDLIELLLNQRSQGRQLVPEPSTRDLVELLLNQQPQGRRPIPELGTRDLVELLLNQQSPRTQLLQCLLNYGDGRLRSQGQDRRLDDILRSADRLPAMNAFRSTSREAHVCKSDPELEKERIEDVVRDMLGRLILDGDEEAVRLRLPSSAYPTPEDHPTPDNHRRGPQSWEYEDNNFAARSGPSSESSAANAASDMRSAYSEPHRQTKRRPRRYSSPTPRRGPPRQSVSGSEYDRESFEAPYQSATPSNGHGKRVGGTRREKNLTSHMPSDFDRGRRKPSNQTKPDSFTQDLRSHRKVAAEEEAGEDLSEDSEDGIKAREPQRYNVDSWWLKKLRETDGRLFNPPHVPDAPDLGNSAQVSDAAHLRQSGERDASAERPASDKDESGGRRVASRPLSASKQRPRPREGAPGSR